MKRLKMISCLFCIFTMCGVSTLMDVNASARAMVYDIGNASDKHTYQGATQYYRIDGIVTVIGGKRNIGNLTNTWFTSGSATFEHSTISLYKSNDSYKHYIATSTIKINGVANNKALLCTLPY